MTAAGSHSGDLYVMKGVIDRLNIGRGLRSRSDDPQVQGASKRFAASARPVIATLTQLQNFAPGGPATSS